MGSQSNGTGPECRGGNAAVRPRDTAARVAGIFLLLTALTTLAAVVTRVAADADQPTLLDSLAAVSQNKGAYFVSGAARLLSGITLVVAAWFLARTWIIRQRLGTPIVPALFAASGLLTSVSGAGAVILALSVPDVSEAVAVYARDSFAEPISDLRWFTGKAGFAAAGLALIVAALYQWKVGGTLRRISPGSAIIGLAMQFIWIDAATFMHRIIGPAFFLWLIVIGAMLMSGRVERHFTAMLDSYSESSEPDMA